MRKRDRGLSQDLRTEQGEVVESGLSPVVKLFFAFFILLSGNRASGDIEVTDDLNRKVVFDAIPRRLVSLAPSNTEILFALGLGDNLFGVTTYCNYPPGAKLKEKVGDFSSIDLEKIVRINPDAVFATGLEQMTNVAKLEKLGFKIVVVYPSSVEEVYRAIEILGRVTGKGKEAESLITETKKRIEKIESAVRPVPEADRPKVFIEIVPDPIMTAGKGSLVDDLIRIAGGRNIAHDVVRPYCQFSIEEIIMRNPDIIILGYMAKTGSGRDRLLNREGFTGISAVKTRRVFEDINPDILFHPSQRIADGIEALYRVFYPNEAVK